MWRWGRRPWISPLVAPMVNTDKVDRVRRVVLGTAVELMHYHSPDGFTCTDVLHY